MCSAVVALLPMLQKQQATMWQCGFKFHNFTTVYLCSSVVLHVFINKDSAYLQMSSLRDYVAGRVTSTQWVAHEQDFIGKTAFH